MIFFQKTYKVVAILLEEIYSNEGNHTVQSENLSNNKSVINKCGTFAVDGCYLSATITGFGDFSKDKRNHKFTVCAISGV